MSLLIRSKGKDRKIIRYYCDNCDSEMLTVGDIGKNIKCPVCDFNEGMVIQKEAGIYDLRNHMIKTITPGFPE